MHHQIATFCVYMRVLLSSQPSSFTFRFYVVCKSSGMLLFRSAFSREWALPQAVNCAVAVALHFAFYRKKIFFNFSSLPTTLSTQCIVSLFLLQRMWKKKQFVWTTQKMHFIAFYRYHLQSLEEREKKINVDISFLY